MLFLANISIFVQHPLFLWRSHVTHDHKLVMCSNLTKHFTKYWCHITGGKNAEIATIHDQNIKYELSCTGSIPVIGRTWVSTAPRKKKRFFMIISVNNAQNFRVSIQFLKNWLKIAQKKRTKNWFEKKIYKKLLRVVLSARLSDDVLALVHERGQGDQWEARIGRCADQSQRRKSADQWNGA